MRSGGILGQLRGVLAPLEPLGDGFADLLFCQAVQRHLLVRQNGVAPLMADIVKLTGEGERSVYHDNPVTREVRRPHRVSPDDDRAGYPFDRDGPGRRPDLSGDAPRQPYRNNPSPNSLYALTTA